MIDRRSALLHRLVARKLVVDPAMLDQARANLVRWQVTNPDQQALAEWTALLAHSSVEEVARLLLSRSEKAMRLRQSSPFAGLLSEDERKKVFRRYAARRA